MKIRRRSFLHKAAGAAVFPAVSRSALAQSYPNRPVRILVGYPAGGPTDLTARRVCQWLSERMGAPFVIENHPGGSGSAATEIVVRSAADGYTLLLAGVWDTINATLYQKLNFTFINDIAPVAGLVRYSNV